MSVAAVIPPFGFVDETASVTRQQLEAQDAPDFSAASMDRFAQHIGDQAMSVDATLDEIPAAAVVRVGGGDLVGARVTTPPAAHWLDVRDGTAGSPARIGASVSISRSDATTRAEVDAMGPTGTDGPDGATGLRVAVKGTSSNEVQIVAGVFSTWQTSAYSGNGNDSTPLYAFARSTGTGRAIGAYVESRREGASSRGQQGWEFRLFNESGTDDVYSPGSFSKSMGMEFNASGPNRSATVLEVGHGFGQAFDTALAFHPGSVTAAVYRDDSEAERSIFITGPHSKGAIVVKGGAGVVILGREEPTTGSQLLELFAGEGQTFDPILRMGGQAPGVNVSAEWRSAAGTLKGFVTGGAKAFLPETASGDSGFQFTPGKHFHVGAVGKPSVLELGETAPTITGSRGGNAALASLLTSLAGLNLVIDSTTA